MEEDFLPPATANSLGETPKAFGAAQFALKLSAIYARQLAMQLCTQRRAIPHRAIICFLAISDSSSS
jgi:hypothetical protein